MKKHAKALCCIVPWVLAPAAWAATDQGTMLVSATVLETCVITVPPLAFGNYDGTQLDGSANVLVLCTTGTTWAVDIDGGVTNNDIADREMTDGSNRLGYGLFTDAGRTTTFGDGVTGNTVPGTGSGIAQTVTVYGRIDSGQFQPAGVYQDTVTVTVTYP